MSIPPRASAVTILEQMWRRIDQHITRRLQEHTENLLGGVVKGGGLNADMLYGSIPSRETVHNASGGAFTKGQAVYVTGDSSGVTTVAKARANADATMPAVGILGEAIANGADGVMIKTGRLQGIDTSAWAVNTVLYVSSATAGALTSTAPTSRAQIVAVVVKQNATTGVLEVLAGATSRLIDHDHTGTGDGGTLSGDTHDSFSEYAETTLPSTPAANKTRLYPIDVGGRTVWDQLLDTGQVIQHGHELYIVGRNVTGSTIAAGAAVKINGLDSSLISIQLCQANTATGARSIGVTTESIANNANGLVMLRGVAPTTYDTSGAGAAGDPMYVSTSVAGGITGLQPSKSASSFPFQIGIVLSIHASTGQVYINPLAGHVMLHEHTQTIGGGGTLTDSAIATGAEIAVAKLADGDALQVIRTDAAGTGVEWGPAPMVLLASSVVSGSAVASIDFSSIPATYESLYIVITARSDHASAAQNLLCRVNNDSGANYDGQFAAGVAASAIAGESIGSTSWALVGIPITANKCGACQFVLANYARTVLHKTATMVSGYELAAAGSSVVAAQNFFLWRNTAAINRLTFLTTAANIDIGSAIYIYGVPAA